MPIDIKCLRDDQGGDVAYWKDIQKKRFKPEGLVDAVVALDQEARQLATELDTVRTKASAAQKQITALMKAAGKAKTKPDAEAVAALAAEKTAASKLVPDLSARLAAVRAQVAVELGKLGNDLDPTVPVSNDEEKDNAEVAKWGTCRDPAGLQSHDQLLHMIDGYDQERGTAIAGHRAYFLKGPGLALNQALIAYACAFLTARGYTMMQPPFFMKKEAMAAVAQLEDFDESLYKVTTGSDDSDAMYLIATSEQPMCGYHKGEVLSDKDLPKTYGGVSPCFRKEAGKHGKETWGIFRVHQFEKVEQFCVTSPDESAAMQDAMIAQAEEFYRSLELPYHVVNIVSGELNNAAIKKLDLEAWFPSYKAYRELVSCSNCTDYQSRGMNIRYSSKKKDAKSQVPYCHMLNATLCATTRTLSCILENYQTPEGIQVPKVLVPFTGGVTFFPFVQGPKRNLNKEKMERAAARKNKGGKNKGGKNKGGNKKAAPKTNAGTGSGAGGGAGATDAAATTATAPATQAAGPPTAPPGGAPAEA